MSRVLALVVVVAGCDAGAKPTPPPAPSPHVAAVPLPAPVTVQHFPPPTTTRPQHVLLASIDRGPCYGTCPVYTVTVYRDGKVEYIGGDYVKQKGKAFGTVTAEQLAALDKLFTDDHYLAYKDSYEHEDFTDASSATTSYAPVGASTAKQVRHYYGDTSAPESLTKLEESFDTIVNTDRWVGTRPVHDRVNDR